MECSTKKMLIPIKDTGKRLYGYMPVWLYECECGNIKEIRKDSVHQERTKSCGCLYKTRRGKYHHSYRHGMNRTPTYKSWTCMKQRCYNSHNKDFKNYGGRGIQVCERWMIFENFLVDMGERPEDKTIDRIDNDGNYEPSNCKWSTHLEQIHNRRKICKEKK